MSDYTATCGCGAELVTGDGGEAIRFLRHHDATCNDRPGCPCDECAALAHPSTDPDG